jgi:hypothetical protein
MSDLCAAYGCPLFGVHGVSGKWYCGCHFNADPGLNDAITAELHRRPETVERILTARRDYRADAKLEGGLITAIKDAIGQQTIPMEDRQ